MPRTGRPRTPPETRFWAKVEKGPECWLWKAGKSTRGYGMFRMPAQTNHVFAHRMAWELTHGPIGHGLIVCHRCDNPPCVNPGHLFLGTTADNIADKIAKGRQRRGEQMPNAKLTAADVRDIRQLVARGMEGATIARVFGVNRETVYAVVARRIWRHVP